MTEVHVERGSLDDGVVIVFKEFDHRIRMIYDPRRTGEKRALAALCDRIPRLVGAMSVTHHADASSENGLQI